MNAYVFEEIAVGLTEGFEVTVTEEMFDRFLDITGDVNPLHNDAAFAQKKGHPARVAFGMLTASFLSTLAGVYLPGKNSLCQAQLLLIGEDISPRFTSDFIGIGDNIFDLAPRLHHLARTLLADPRNSRNVIGRVAP